MKSLILIVSLSLCLSLSVEAQRRRKRPNQQQPQYETLVEDRRSPPSTEDLAPDCPEPNGFFADADQCDKYWECESGKAKPKFCPDGLVFKEAGSRYEKCELPTMVDCSSRPKLQKPQPSKNCPRKHGYFPHEDPKVCDRFFLCDDGSFNAITCPAGLVFDKTTGLCTWPDEATKSHCSSVEYLEFECPPSDIHLSEDVFRKYPDPKSCQFFYICMGGKVPRKSGCGTGLIYDEKTEQCKSVKILDASHPCKNWYKGVAEVENPVETRPTPRPRPAAFQLGGTRRRNRPQSQPQIQRRIE